MDDDYQERTYNGYTLKEISSELIYQSQDHMAIGVDCAAAEIQALHARARRLEADKTIADRIIKAIDGLIRQIRQPVQSPEMREQRNGLVMAYNAAAAILKEYED